MSTLRGFLRREAIDAMLPQLRRRTRDESFTHARAHNIFFDDEIEGVRPDQPALTRSRLSATAPAI